MQTQKISHKRHRYPPQIIAHVVWLYVRFNLSLREVEELMLERGVDVSGEPAVRTERACVPARAGNVAAEGRSHRRMRWPAGSVMNFVYLARPMRFQILKRRSARRTLWRTDCGPQTIPGRFDHLFRTCGLPDRSAWSRLHRSGMSSAS